MNAAGFEHGRIVSRINARLQFFVEEQQLGVTTGAETGFFIEENPDTVRAPDGGFVRQHRLPSEPVRGYFRGAPDLAVEVISPEDRANEVLAKVHMWLDSGCRSVWTVDPKTQTITIHNDKHRSITLEAGQTLDGGDVLPGFLLPVADIFRLS